MNEIDSIELMQYNWSKACETHSYEVPSTQYISHCEILEMSLIHLFIFYFIKSRPTYQVEKINEVGVCQRREFNEVCVCQRLVCQKREFAVKIIFL